MNENILNIYLFNGLWCNVYLFLEFYDENRFFWIKFFSVSHWNENVWHILLRTLHKWYRNLLNRWKNKNYFSSFYGNVTSHNISMYHMSGKRVFHSFLWFIKNENFVKSDKYLNSKLSSLSNLWLFLNLEI